MQIRQRVALWMLVSVPLVLGVLGTIAFLAQWHFTGEQPQLGRLLLAQSGWLVCAGLAPGVFAASKRWPLSGPHIGRRIALHLGLALVYWALAGVIFQGVLPALFEPMSTVNGVGPRLVAAVAHGGRWFITGLPFGAIVYFAIVGVEHAIRYFGEVRQGELRMSQLEARVASARLAALQSQLNPHFLFNALNTVAVRAREGDGAGTARIVEQLAEILRRTLSREQSPEVSLAEELDIVQQYLAIEQARFADRLEVRVDVDDTVLGAAVPTLALQHLAENAVRHGIARAPDAGIVTIAARRDGDSLEVRVTDDGPGIARPEPEAQSPEPPSGGIANTRERLRSLYGTAQASLVVSGNGTRGTVATLRVPYREVVSELDAGGRW